MEKLRKKAQYQPAVRFIGVFGSVNEEIVNRLLETRPEMRGYFLAISWLS
jgi:hypothetical protein